MPEIHRNPEISDTEKTEVSAFKDKRRTENNRYRYMFGENLHSKVQCKNRTADSKSLELLYGGYNGA